MRRFFAILLMLMFVVSAESYVAINSQDGRDVLSGIYYANVKGVPAKFIPLGGSADIFAAKIGTDKEIFLIQSADLPISSQVETELENRNNVLEIYSSTDGGVANLYLAERSGATTFIIVDSAYSDSAISVLPYASRKQAYVILASRNNIDEIEEIVQGAEEIIIYGLVDQEVRDTLEPYSPVIIGKGEDKFEDNVELVGMMLDEYGSSQLVVSDATFVEEGMIEGQIPILLSGRLVPPVTYDFLKEETKSGRLQGLLLIGNELMMAHYDARQRIEQDLQAEGIEETFGITIKFGQVIPQSGTGVLGLDLFYLPAYRPTLDISEIVYDKGDKELMVTIDNVGEGSAYYTMDVHIYVDGSELTVFGTEDTLLIERGDSVGQEFDLDISDIEAGNVTATIIVKYGTSKASLDSFEIDSGPLQEIVYEDVSEVTVQSARYDEEDEVVTVSIRNIGDVTAYHKTDITLLLEGEETTLKSPGVGEIEPASLVVVEFPLVLTEEDIEANEEITVHVQYGARPGFLVKEDSYQLSLEKPEEFPLWLVAVVLVVIVVAAYLFLRKKK